MVELTFSLLLDSTSIATEYSLKFDESMTEDEIEEKSFRSLLPSESHRRFNMEKKRGHHDDSDEEGSPDKTTLSSAKVCFYLYMEIHSCAWYFFKGMRIQFICDLSCRLSELFSYNN
jgi:hypothetical protein